MVETAATLLEHFRTSYGKDIDLTLRPAYRDLLVKLGNPHQSLPPVFHVAGTNGKGSTCAFLRAMLEAAGHRVHVYTSPHLVQFNERIRIAGSLIGEDELTDILSECKKLAIPHGVSYFEATTAAALTAFARHPADFTILETGLGGRLDATNIVEKPLATLITRLSLDHRDYLGDTIDKIACEKAGIMRSGVPCFVAAQPDLLAIQTLRDRASTLKTPLSVGGTDWIVKETAEGFHFSDATRAYDLPAPALLGAHQYQNAGLAIAALAALPQALPEAAIRQGLQKVEWPARLQRLTKGSLIPLLPKGSELWLDGGHNDSAGEVLAAQIQRWQREDGAKPKPLFVILGMLTTKRPDEFLTCFGKYVAQLRTVAIQDEPLSFTASALAEEALKTGITQVKAIHTIQDALIDLGRITCLATPPRILICGSLYLAGKVLATMGK